MNPTPLVAAAAGIAVGYLVAGEFSRTLAVFLTAGAVALVAVSMLVIAVLLSRVAADPALIRAAMAQWMRDPKSADPTCHLNVDRPGELVIRPLHGPCR